MSEASTVALTLVVPVWNGAAFLPRTLAAAWAWLAARTEPCELLVVDDGSADATPQVLAEFAAGVAGSARTRCTVVRNAENRGKGWSLRRGFALARGELVAFTDADLTYELDNLEPILQALRAGADVACGSRLHQDSVYVVAPSFFGKLFTRHLFGRTFNFVVRLLVVPGIRDTQAGIKGFRRAAARELALRVRLPRFSFDVELLFVARRRGLRVVECPVRFIYRKEPSTVRLWHDSLAMFADMLRIRWRGLRGVYDRAPDPALQRELEGAAAAPLVDPARRPVARDSG